MKQIYNTTRDKILLMYCTEGLRSENTTSKNPLHKRHHSEYTQTGAVLTGGGEPETEVSQEAASYRMAAFKRRPEHCADSEASHGLHGNHGAQPQDTFQTNTMNKTGNDSATGNEFCGHGVKVPKRHRPRKKNKSKKTQDTNKD
jgi:hypothetical protein